MNEFENALVAAFKLPECRYIDLDAQRDRYGSKMFKVVEIGPNIFGISFEWGESPDDWVEFEFDDELNYTSTMNGKVVSGNGYEDAALQYVLRIANKYAEGEDSKDFQPEYFELYLYLNRDFYSSRKVWEPIRDYLENHCDSNPEPEDYVEERAAVWYLERRDLEKVLKLLKGKKFKIFKDFDDVTSQFTLNECQVSGDFQKGAPAKIVNLTFLGNKEKLTESQKELIKELAREDSELADDFFQDEEFEGVEQEAVDFYQDVRKRGGFNIR